MPQPRVDNNSWHFNTHKRTRSDRPPDVSSKIRPPGGGRVPRDPRRGRRAHQRLRRRRRRSVHHAVRGDRDTAVNLHIKKKRK